MLLAIGNVIEFWLVVLHWTASPFRTCKTSHRNSNKKSVVSVILLLEKHEKILSLLFLVSDDDNVYNHFHFMNEIAKKEKILQTIKRFIRKQQ